MKNKDRRYNAASQVSPKPAWAVVTGSHVAYHRRKLLVETIRKTQAEAWAALGSQDKIAAARKRGAMVLAFVVSPKTRPPAVDWQSRALAAEAEVERLRRERDVFRAAFEELHATVKGECPSILNEDSGAAEMLLQLVIAAEELMKP